MSPFPKSDWEIGFNSEPRKKKLLTQCQFPLFTVIPRRGAPLLSLKVPVTIFKYWIAETNSNQQTSLKNLILSIESYVWQVGLKALDDARVPIPWTQRE